MEMDYFQELQAEADRYKHLYEIFKERADKAEAAAEKLKAALLINMLLRDPGLSHAEINAEIERILNQGGNEN